MKKQYSAPVAETIKLQLTQVLCESGANGLPGEAMATDRKPSQTRKKATSFGLLKIKELGCVAL